MSTQFSDAGYQYQLVVRGECGPLLTGWFGDAAVESARGRTCISFTVRDDSELYGLLDRIQDLALHLISLNEVDGAAAMARRAEALRCIRGDVRLGCP